MKKYRFPATKLSEQLRSLNQYAVEIRYPGNTASLSEAKSSVRAMELVARACRRILAP